MQGRIEITIYDKDGNYETRVIDHHCNGDDPKNLNKCYCNQDLLQCKLLNFITGNEDICLPYAEDISTLLFLLKRSGMHPYEIREFFETFGIIRLKLMDFFDKTNRDDQKYLKRGHQDNFVEVQTPRSDK